MTALTVGGNGAAATRSRNQFLANSVHTASPAVLLVMLVDRLVLDVTRAEEAQRAGRRSDANKQLNHAQDIVAELMSSLDVDRWDGGERLLAIYTFLLSELVRANVSADPERTAACRLIVEPLRDTWREAAGMVASAAGTSGSTTVG